MKTQTIKVKCINSRDSWKECNQYVIMNIYVCMNMYNVYECNQSDLNSLIRTKRNLQVHSDKQVTNTES